MDLEQTKRLVDNFFSTTDQGAVITSNEPDEEAKKWLRGNGYFLKGYEGVHCIAKLEKFIPSEEKAKEMKAKMEERVREGEKEKIRSDIARLLATELSTIPF